MCGIVGYIGSRRVVPILFEGLKRLEYRGYDSAGLVYLHKGRLVKYRSQGKLVKLEENAEEAMGVNSHVGLGHTRWATHGAPSTENAHPHSDCTGDLVLVHNGIIENYHSLKEALKKTGGNQRKAAKLLNISRDALRYRLKKMDLTLGEEN